MKPVLKQVSMRGLLYGIAQIQPEAGEQEKEPVLRLLKEAIEAIYPEYIVTWTSITRTRTEALIEGLIVMNGYAHTLTPEGKKKLLTLESYKIPKKEPVTA